MERSDETAPGNWRETDPITQNQNKKRNGCEMSKTSWQTGKLPMKDGSENHSKDDSLLLEQWLNITRFQHEINQDFTNLVRQFYQEYFLSMH